MGRGEEDEGEKGWGGRGVGGDEFKRGGGVGGGHARSGRRHGAIRLLHEMRTSRRRRDMSRCRRGRATDFAAVVENREPAAEHYRHENDSMRSMSPSSSADCIATAPPTTQMSFAVVSRACCSAPSMPRVVGVTPWGTFPGTATTERTPACRDTASLPAP